MAGDEGPRERILRVAGPIFAHRGYESATVREIAAAADVNVASIAYYFGDKMRLYREVVRQSKLRQAEAHPIPALSSEHPPEEQLALFVRGMLSRLLDEASASWELQLMMREMVQPTEALTEIVDEFFRPVFEQLQRILDAVARQPLEPGSRLRLALGVVAQCIHYRIGQGVIERLITPDERRRHLDQQQLVDHVVAVTVAAAERLVTQSSAKDRRSDHELSRVRPTAGGAERRH